MRRALLAWTVLAAVALAGLLLALTIGSSRFSAMQIVQALATGDSLAHDIVMRLRLPRALAAFATGGLLALAGALMQILLRNPLADPYVLGLSGGAAVGALGAMLLGLTLSWVNVGAFGGALLAMLIVFGLARGDFARRQHAALDASPRLLLTGVVLASGWGAIITLMLTLAPEAKLRGMLFWLIGDLNGANIYGLPLVVLCVALAFAYPSARALNVLARGETVAQSLGVDVARLRKRIYVLASAATAVAVTTGGSIGFVGLVVPHALRLVLGNDQRVLLPASVLAGGALLLIADTFARTVIAPQQLPVGVITAALGVPAFLTLLHRGRAGR